MIVWGGYSGPYLRDGAAYDPSTGTWVAISTTTAPSARTGATAVWTGSKMIVWSGAYAAQPVVDGIFNRDYFVIQNTILIFAIIFLIVNLLVDILYAVLNPRIRYA
jgi:hypothetical protein